MKKTDTKQLTKAYNMVVESAITMPVGPANLGMVIVQPDVGNDYEMEDEFCCDECKCAFESSVNRLLDLFDNQSDIPIEFEPNIKLATEFINNLRRAIQEDQPVATDSLFNLGYENV